MGNDTSDDVVKDKNIYKNKDAQDRESLLSGFRQFWSIASADSPVNAGINSISGISQGMINNAIQNWLGQKANFQLKYSSDGQGEVNTLLPLMDKKDTFLFTQLGLRRNDDRTTYNVGLGARNWINSDWMLGINSFWDYDSTGDNSRVGVGMEAWTNYLKLATNGYFRLTDWHQSPLSDMEDYDERPANGFDIRTSTWLPFYPQVGADLVWEKYYGKDVAISPSSTTPDDLEDSPSVVTASVNYTPFPLMSLNAGHRGGSISENFVDVSFNYRLGVSWDEQIDTETVSAMRSLAGSRYDFVDRNNAIVMQYRKQDLIGLSLSAPDTAEAASRVTVTANVHTKYGLKNIHWMAPELIAAGGSILQSSATSLAVTLPGFHADTANSYTISAVATDVHGNDSPQAFTTIGLIRSSNGISLNVTPADNIVANGQDQAVATAWVKGKDGTGLANMKVDFTLSGKDKKCLMNGKSQCETQVTTDASGKADVSLSSLKAGEYTLLAALDNGNTDTKSVSFIADASTASLAALVANPAKNITADGKTVSVVTATLNDHNGNPVKGGDVSFSADNSARLSAGSAKSDANGNAVVKITSEQAGDVNVHATATTDTQGMTTTLSFVADASSGNVTLSADKQTVTANGKDVAVLTAIVKDTHGNAVSGTPLTFSADKSVTLSESSGVTDANGQITLKASSTHAGDMAVTVHHAASGTSDSLTLTFAPDSATATVSDITASPSENITADGKAYSTVTATVHDANGNPVSGANVSFSSDGAISLSDSTATANKDGQASITVSSQQAGSYNVNAKTPQDSQGKSVAISFTGDSSTASVDALSATPSQGVTADGVMASTLVATIKDASGNVLKGVNVIFTGDPGIILSGTQAVSDSRGQAQISVTSKTAGAHDISASTAFDKTGKTTSVTFVADSQTAMIQSLTATPADGVTADGKTASTLAATVVDVNGNILPGATVTFKPDASITLASATAVSDDKGVATTTATSTTSGSYHVTAVTDYDADGKTASIGWVADSSTAGVGELTVISNDAVADGVTADELRVLVKDGNGNVVPAVNVTLSADTGVTLSETKVTTGADGTATFKATSKQMGTFTVTATVNQQSQSKDIEFVADGSTAKVASLTAAPAENVSADGTTTSVLTALVKDSNGNVLGSTKVTFSSDNEALKLSASTAVTDENGQATVSATSLLSGIYTVTAAVNGSSAKSTVTFIADEKTAKVETVVASPASDVVADGVVASTVTATVKDSNGNVVVGETVTFKGDQALKLNAESAVTDSQGQAKITATSKTAGTYTVSATIDQDPTGKSAQITYTGDTASSRVDSIAADPASDVTADGKATSTVTATIKDANGNILPGVSVAFIGDTGVKLSAGKATTDDSGQAKVTVTSLLSGAFAIQATTANDSTGKKVTVTFTADSASAKVDSLNAVPATGVAADGATQSTLTATVKDAQGNLVKDAVVTFATDGDAKLSATTGKTDASGQILVTLTSTKAGEHSVNATTGSDKTGKTAKVAFVADSKTAKVTTLSADPASGIVADGTALSTLTAVVSDASGNLVSGATVNFKADSNAVLSGNSAVTDDNGKATVTMTSTHAGSWTATATTAADSTGKNVAVSFKSGDVDASKSTFTVDKTIIPSDGKTTLTLTFSAIDKNGNPVTGADITFSPTDLTGAVISAVQETDGVYTATMTATKASSGSVTVTNAGNSVEGMKAIAVGVYKSTLNIAVN
ncbi:Ig-like domain-containing protein [Citrobacter sp. ANG330]|uniref:Ig-like domain-containing protein n=1 Tax=Citrobacter sp. ANG330 TaxID=3048142 RepID=UPI0039C19026